MCTSQQWQEMKPGAHFMSRRGAARLEAVALHRLVVSPRRVLQRQSVRDNYDVEAALIRRGVSRRLSLRARWRPAVVHFGVDECD